MPMSRRHLILGSAAAGSLASLGTPGAAASQTASGPAAAGGASLRHRADAKGLLFGTAVGPLLDRDRAYRDAVVADCNAVVPEYEMKWKEVAPAPGFYDFAASDRRFAFARDHGMEFRGHTLVWNDGMPDWFANHATRLNVEEMLAAHIGTVVGRYAGRVHSWDVVNEPLDLSGNGEGGWRRGTLLTLMGQEYVAASFRIAAALDPRARLVLNEFGTLQAGPEAEAKRTAVLRLLERLRAAGVPVHAFGIQGHIATAGRDAIDEAAVARFCAELAGMGLEIMLTELDVSDQFAPADVPARDAAVAEAYRRVLSVVLDCPATTAVLTWGLSDRNTWLAEHRARADGLPVRPLLYDTEMRRKPAWDAVAAALDAAAPRPRRAG